MGVVAQNVSAKPTLEPSSAQFDREMADQGMCAPNTPGITDTAIQQDRLTEPSLWWVRDQIAAQDKFGRRLVDSWLACPGSSEPSRVDLVVNTQLWSLLDFFDRYEFIQRFGTATAGYGYNLRVLTPQGRMLAAYTCSFSSNLAEKQSESKTLACRSFDRLARTSFWSPTKSTVGF